nr:immunoglobulin heavy chain junction region [Macaca mulatta]MOW99001.1 immunoglobulin heavy chain junction region [Macaca mulatta]MOW99057.1 immunoglobulin heavy chain junction region [Macaca mulatta]MOX00560.1 immunoglobulin heavy chain junction region [Macaca mulatta]MOX00934.1 immunoglobulin heavy chain junction region [Macaca mulatta]
CARDQSNHDHW